MYRKLFSVVFWATLLFACFVVCSARDIRVSNSIPRRDKEAHKIMDIHDSKVTLHDGTYHWFGASYGNCTEPSGTDGCSSMRIGSCGFRTDHNVSLYTSTDLATWTYRGVVFEAEKNLPPNSVLFAPKTVFNPRTKTWVMWYNYIVNGFDHSYYGVATSLSPIGPFQVEVPKVESLQFGPNNGDENIFIDNDGVGYLIYTSISELHRISVERMVPDCTATEGAANSSGLIPWEIDVEAPAMFKRGSVYYITFGSCCCYCEKGSKTVVFTSISPLGPFTIRSDLGDLRSQQTDVFAFQQEDGSMGYMYIGDHWQSAPDGVKGHDFTVWEPLLFSKDGMTVKTNGFEASFEIQIP